MSAPQILLLALIASVVAYALVAAFVEFVRECRADRAYTAHVDQALAVTR